MDLFRRPVPFHRVKAASRRRRPEEALSHVNYLSSALAFLTKGLIGVVFPFAVLGVWLVIGGQWKRTVALFSPVGITLFLVITLPWIVLVQQEHGDFLRFFSFRNIF